MTHSSPHSIDADLHSACTLHWSINQTNSSISAILGSYGEETFALLKLKNRLLSGAHQWEAPTILSALLYVVDLRNTLCINLLHCFVLLEYRNSNVIKSCSLAWLSLEYASVTQSSEVYEILNSTCDFRWLCYYFFFNTYSMWTEWTSWSVVWFSNPSVWAGNPNVNPRNFINV